MSEAGQVVIKWNSLQNGGSFNLVSLHWTDPKFQKKVKDMQVTIITYKTQIVL